MVLNGAIPTLPIARRTLNTNRGSFGSSTGYDVFAKYQFSGMTLLGDYIGSSLENAVGLPSNPKGWLVQLINGTGLEPRLHTI